MDKKEFRLTTLYFYISGGCNLSCKHCWISPESKNGDLNSDGVKDVINQAVELGARNVKLTGGEPFLRKDIFQILQFIREKNLAVIIETNGTFIQEREAEELKRLGVGFISVSIDGPDAEFHDKLRGVKGAFEMAVRGIKALKKAGFSPQVIACIYRKNVSDIERLALLVQDLGAGSLKLNPIMQIGRGENFDKEKELLGVKELLELERYIQENLQPKVKLSILLDIPFAFKKLSYIKSNHSRCGLLGMIGILSDGTVSICGIGEEIKELNMGSIKKNRLRDIWEDNEILNFIRVNIPDKLEGICERCVFKRLCLGKCRAHAYHESKSLTAPFYFCQEAYESSFFPETRIISSNISGP